MPTPADPPDQRKQPQHPPHAPDEGTESAAPHLSPWVWGLLTGAVVGAAISVVFASSLIVAQAALDNVLILWLVLALGGTSWLWSIVGIVAIILAACVIAVLVADRIYRAFKSQVPDFSGWAAFVIVLCCTLGVAFTLIPVPLRQTVLKIIGERELPEPPAEKTETMHMRTADRRTAADQDARAQYGLGLEQPRRPVAGMKAPTDIRWSAWAALRADGAEARTALDTTQGMRDGSVPGGAATWPGTTHLESPLSALRDG